MWYQLNNFKMKNLFQVEFKDLKIGHYFNHYGIKGTVTQVERDGLFVYVTYVNRSCLKQKRFPYYVKVRQVS